jgi:hypothetical protein
MLRDLDPPMDGTTRGRLTRLIDAIETGPAPSLDELRDGAARPLQIVTGDRGPAGARRPGRTPLVVGIAAAVALLLGALAVLRASDDDEGRVSNDPDDVPRLVPDPATLPDGLDPAYAVDLPVPAADLGPGSATVTLYGDAEAAASGGPVADADLAVIVVQDETIGLGGSTTSVRGREGRSGTSSDANDVGIAVTDDFVWLSWDETDEVEVTLASRRLGHEALATIAEDLTVDGSTVRLGDLPAGVDGTEIGSLPDIPFAGLPYASASDPGHAFYYGLVIGTSTLVQTFVGDSSDLLVARWMSGADQPITIRGHSGWYGESTGVFQSTAQTLLWEEADGVIGVIQTAGMSQDDLVQLANDLHPATDEEWQALLDATSSR